MADQRIVRATKSDSNSSTDQNQLLFKTSSFALLRAKHGLSPRQSTIENAYIMGAKRVLDFMYNLWVKNRLCDVAITSADEKTLHAHKIAVGAYSNSLSERFQQQTPGSVCHLQIGSYKADTIFTILKFFYTTDIELNDNVLDPTLGCSLEMGVDMIIRLCKDYLCRFNLETALLYHSIAEKYDLLDIEERIYDFISEHFREISQTNGYLRAHLRLIRKLANENRLIVTTELDVFLAVVAWIDHDRQERLSFAPGLVSCVRMHLITPEELVSRVEVVEHIFSITQCQRQLYSAIKYHALKLSGSILSESFPVQTPRGRGQPRSATSDAARYNRDGQETHRSIKMTSDAPRYSRDGQESRKTTMMTPDAARYNRDGQESRKSTMVTPDASRYNRDGQEIRKTTVVTPDAPRYDRDGQESRKSTKNTYHASVVKAEPATGVAPPASRYISTADGYNVNRTNQLIVVAVGGIDLQNTDSETPGRCVFKLDHSAGRWGPLTQLGQYTHHHGVVAIGNTIYVIGGAVYDPNDPERLGGATSATYAYNGRSGQWRRLADMHEARAYLAVAANNGSIYAVGGEDENRRKLDSIECYDVIADKWSIIARMPHGGKIGMTAATWREALYIVGGYTRGRPGNPVLGDVECFDLQRQRWLPRRPLELARCHASLVAARGRLYLVGGRAKLEGPPPTITSLSNVDVYDERADTWRRVAELNLARHDAGCAVVGSHIYVVGGMKTPSPYCLSSVECFDVTSGRWEQNVVDLPYNTSGVACCALMTSA